MTKFDVYECNIRNIQEKSKKTRKNFRFVSEKLGKLSDDLIEAYRKIYEAKKIPLGDEEVSEDSLKKIYELNDHTRNILSSLKARKEKMGDELIKYTRLRRFDLVKILLEDGADPNSCQDRFDFKNNISIRYPVLRVAIHKGDLQITQLLLNYGADINFILEKDRTYLYLVALRQDFAMMHLLLENGIDSSHLDYKKQNFVEYFRSVHFRRNTKKEQKKDLGFDYTKNFQFLAGKKMAISCEMPQNQSVFSRFFGEKENYK